MRFIYTVQLIINNMFAGDFFCIKLIRLSDGSTEVCKFHSGPGIKVEIAFLFSYKIFVIIFFLQKYTLAFIQDKQSKFSNAQVNSDTLLQFCWLKVVHFFRFLTIYFNFVQKIFTVVMLYLYILYSNNLEITNVFGYPNKILTGRNR